MATPDLYIKAAAAAVVFGLGFSAAWKIQQYEIDAANARTAAVTADFNTYRNEQARLTLQRELEAAEQREKSDDDWKKTVERLKNERLAYGRCVVAGRCVDLQRLCPAQPHAPPGPRSETETVPPAGQFDGPSADTVPLAAGLAAECEITTAQINALQADIEQQPGYK